MGGEVKARCTCWLGTSAHGGDSRAREACAVHGNNRAEKPASDGTGGRDEEIAEIEARVDAATTNCKWHLAHIGKEYPERGVTNDYHIGFGALHTPNRAVVMGENARANAEFFLVAPADIRRLIDLLKASRRRLAELEQQQGDAGELENVNALNAALGRENTRLLEDLKAATAEVRRLRERYETAQETPPSPPASPAKEQEDSREQDG